MDTLFRPKSLKALDSEIERLVNKLAKLEPTDKEYSTIADNIRVLTESREKKNSSDISNEAVLAAIVNVASLLIILNFERTGTITSKAFGLLWKGKS
jgi:hypothetical protein